MIKVIIRWIVLMINVIVNDQSYHYMSCFDDSCYSEWSKSSLNTNKSEFMSCFVLDSNVLYPSTLDFIPFTCNRLTLLVFCSW